MGLSDNAIGFFLEMEDVSLSSTLSRATTNYEKYVKSLETFNDRAFASSSKGLGQIESMLKSVADLPTATERAMKGASAKIGKSLKPITQKVDLAISVSSKAKLRKAVGSAVADAMGGANVRLTATMPDKRMALFDNALGLRAQYNQQTQPPDMKGKIQPLKKYAEGGVVDGPPGLDKVFAMLTKGEIVIPAEISKQLASVAGRSLKTGEFDEAGLKKVIKMTRGFDGDVEELHRGLSMVHKDLDNMTDVMKARLSGAMLQAKKRMEDLDESGEDAGGTFENFFKKILGPARFLALRAQIDDLRDGVSSLRSKGHAAFTTLGGDAIGSGIDSINQMNQFLGVSREHLSDIKARAGAMAKEVDGITFDELGFGLKTAAELGIRNEDVLFGLAKTSALAAKGLDVASESATKLGFELTQSLNVSEEGFEATLASMSKLSDSESGFNISSGKLFEQTAADVGVLNTALLDLDDTTTQRLLGSFNQVGAVLESNFIDGAADIRQVLAKAFEGGPENMEAIATATQLTGLAQDDLKAKLLSGDLEGIFNRIGSQVQGLSTDQIKALSSQIGISSDDLGRFGNKIGDINVGFDKAQTRIVATGDGLAILEERARGNRTAFEKFQEMFTDSAGALTIFGINGVEVLDFFKEFNPLSLLAVASLSKTALGAATSAAAFFGMGGGAAAGGAGLTGIAGAAAKVGPVLGKLAAAAGPFALVASAIGGLTAYAIDSIQTTNKITEDAQNLQSKLAHKDPTRLKKNIKRVQSQIDIDEAAGKIANPTKVAMLERYNQELAELEASLKATYGKDSPGQTASVTQPDAALPVSMAEIAAMSGGVPSSGATEEKLDKNNMLMEQLVGLVREQVTQGRTRSNPTPAAQAPSQGLSSFGQEIAGGGI